jgi:hypothetical protein
MPRPPSSCLNCDRPRSRPGPGLCLRCYHRGRAAYVPAGRREPSTLPTPTSALPGTEAKIAVMAARLAAGERLWHPGDGRGDTA